MTHEQIRIACAESVGLGNRFVLMKRGLYYRPDAHGYTHEISMAWVVSEEEANKHVYPYDEPVTKHPAPLPPYDSSADAALELVEALRKDGWHWMICPITQGYSCDVIRSGMGREIMSSAPTLPLAICGAYLKAKGLWKEGA